MSDESRPDEAFVQHWNEIEREFASRRELSSSDKPDQRIFRETMLEKNAKVCEALVIQGGASPLFELRALLFRGRLKEAREFLASHPAEKALLAEFANERARLHCYNGEWSEALEAVKEAITLAPDTVTRLALHQIEALARFELGDLEGARRALDLADSLIELFPHCPAAHYVRVQNARLLAREAGVGAGKAALLTLLERDAENGTLDSDKLTAIFRAQAELLCMEGQPHFQFALAAQLLSDASGDRLYSAIGLLDLYAAGATESRAALEPRIRQAAKEFPRVAAAFEQLVGTTQPSSTSVRTLAGFPGASDALQRRWIEGAAFNLIILPETQICVGLQPLKVVHLSGQYQVFQALRFLQQGPVPKKEFFRILWGEQKYSPRLHDPLISRLLYRMRKSPGIRAHLEQGQVTMKDRAVILCF
jgi:hypothetical protein